MFLMQNNYDQEMVEGVQQVDIGVWNPQDILNGSVCHVLSTATYENNRPVINGLFDLRMGTIEQGFTCETCQQDYRGCPGHFGHIMLVRPVYHMQFLKFMLKIARCFCYVCSECLVPLDNEETNKTLKSKPMKTRFQYVYKEYKDSNDFKVCHSCKTDQPIKYSNPRNTQDNSGGIAKVYAEFKTSNEKSEKLEKKYISCEQMLEFLKRIKDEDLDMIGIPSKISRPDWMICTIFPVPPPHVRPSVRQENNQKSEDDLTHKLAEIITRNQTLREEIEKSDKPGTSADQAKRSSIIDDWTQVLQYHVSTFIDNEIPGIPRAIQRSGRPIKALKQRLQAKDGRMRYNLMGKRGDYTARTVITAEPNIALDELGIPKKIAMNLTFPENVNSNNIERLRINVKNGVHIYPGAKSVQKRIKKANGTMIYQMYSLTITSKKGINIEIGDIVHRHLQDGDLVFFNRQPSLHKMSMMGHRIRVLEVGNTFRLNVSATTPYNADFDGDEMNVFLTQCMEGVAELKYLTIVQNQIVSPQRNQCVIGLVQDTLFTCPQLTRPDTYLSRNNYMNLLMYISKDNETFKIPEDKKELTGRSLFEKLIPKLDLHRQTNEGKYRKNPDLNLVIKDGKIIKGHVDKNTVGTSAGGLIHVIWKDYNPSKSANFIYNCQKLCTQWLLTEGHSMGVSDCIFLDDKCNSNKKVYTDIHDIIYEAVCHVNYLLESAKKGLYKTRSDRPISQDIESEISYILNKARDDTANKGVIEYVLDHNRGNRLVKMVMSGSKGDMNNVAQIMCTMGQSEVAGARTPMNFAYRTLPHYTKFDHSPEARGFSMHSFKDGLDPNEFYFLASSTRIGLIDKTVKTADTGYTQRRLIKSMEDLTVHYDGSVRSANNSILQFAYGDDYFDATFLETLHFNYHKMGENEFIELMLLEGQNDIQYQNLLELKNNVKIQMGNHEVFYSPVNINRLIHEIKNEVEIVEDSQSRNEINLQFSEELIAEMDKFVASYFKQKKHGNLVPQQMYMFQMYYTFELSLKRLLHYKGINRAVFTKLILKIQEKFKLAICPSGEMVGIICGQSIGEPTTQMTLNKFHHIGTGSKSNTTTGVPRMKELLAVSKKIKTPSMTLYLKSNVESTDENPIEYDLDYNQVRDFSMQFEYTKLSDICKKLDIFCELQGEQVDPTNTVYQEDQEWFDLLKETESQDYFEKLKSFSWVVRIELDKFKYNLMGIDVSTIQTLIEDNIRKIPSKNKSLQSTENIVLVHPEEEIIRIYIKINDQLEQNVWLNFYKIVEKIIMNTKLKGIEGISSVSVSESKGKNGKKEFTLYTTGSRVKETLVFKEKPIIINVGQNRTIQIKLDKSRIKTNDVQEMFDVYGIEMARHMLIEEFQEVLSEAGGVNMRHITILVDTMTSRGNLIPIDRHGVKKNEIGPLSRATFEETVDQLLKAATFGEKDSMNGVSANIMMGQIAPCGTGTVSLLLDETKILSAKHLLEKEDSIPEDIGIMNTQIETIENVIKIDKKPIAQKTFKFTNIEPIRWFGNINSRVIIA